MQDDQNMSTNPGVKKHNEAFFKSILTFLLLLFILHALFSVVFYKLIIEMAFIHPNLPEQNSMVLAIYGVMVYLLFAAYFAHSSTSDVTQKERLKAAMKRPAFSTTGYFLKELAAVHACRVGIFMLYQIPFAIFFANFGFSFAYTIPFEAQFRLEAGIYMLADNWFFGLLLVTAIFSIFLFALQYVFLWLTCRSILKNAPEGLYKADRRNREVPAVLLRHGIYFLYIFWLLIGMGTGILKENAFAIAVSVIIGAVLGLLLLWKWLYVLYLYIARTVFYSSVLRLAKENKWDCKRHHSLILSFFQSYSGADISLYDRKNEIHLKFFPFLCKGRAVHIQSREKIIVSTIFPFLFIRGKKTIGEAKDSLYGMDSEALLSDERNADLSFGAEKGITVFLMPRKCIRLTCLGENKNTIDMIDNGYLYDGEDLFYDEKRLLLFLEEEMKNH